MLSNKKSAQINYHRSIQDCFSCQAGYNKALYGGRESNGCERVSPGSLSLFHNQFITYPPDVYDPNARVLGEAVTETSDKYLEAAGVEEVVIAPEGQEDVLGRDAAAAAFA